MTVAIGNTNLTNTFQYWRDRTNEMAFVISTQAVTVNSNAAVGNASVYGTFYANSMVAGTLAGGNTSVSANLTITTGVGMNSTLSVNGAATFANSISITGSASFANTITITGASVTMGNTVIRSANVTADAYYGTWQGNSIPTNKGGTGTTVAPTSGQLLIGRSTGAYALTTLTQGSGASITNGNGAITISTTVAGLANGAGIVITSNASNVYTITANAVVSFQSNNTNIRAGAITLTGNDVIYALGYIPGAANGALWLPANTEAYYNSGNVAIGFFVANTAGGSANSTLDVRAMNNDGTKHIIRAENGNTSLATNHSYVDINVANTGAKSGLSFSRGTIDTLGWRKGSIEYRHANEQLAIFTSGTERVTLDGLALGLGNTAPQPNEGGQGIHITASVPGVTLDSTTTSGKFHMGINPAYDALNGGARLTNAFAIYSDTAQSGLVWKGVNANTGTFQVYAGNSPRFTVLANGNVGVGNTAPTHALSVTGDVMASGYQTLSDYRYKMNITLMANATAKIKQLKVYDFDYKSGPYGQHGFLAHELQEVIPSAVRGVMDGFEPQTVDMTKVVPFLVKTIQELINRVEELEKKNGE